GFASFLLTSFQFSTSNPESAYIVSAALTLMLPTAAPPPENTDFQPKKYLPSKLGRVRKMDVLSNICSSLPSLVPRKPLTDVRLSLCRSPLKNCSREPAACTCALRALWNFYKRTGRADIYRHSQALGDSCWPVES